MVGQVGGSALGEGLLLLGLPMYPILYGVYFFYIQFSYCAIELSPSQLCYLPFHIAHPRQYPHVFLLIYPSLLFLPAPHDSEPPLSSPLCLHVLVLLT